MRPPFARSGIRVTTLDFLVLLDHVLRGAALPDLIGWEDAENTLKDMTKLLTKDLYIEKNTLESALWSVNLMNEAGKYSHPLGVGFDDWLKQLLGPRKFNKQLNIIEEKKHDSENGR